jgi:uncharacterized protein YjbJ (UPF0337 family)
VKGKIQNAWGQAKDAARDVLKKNEESKPAKHNKDEDAA